MTEEKKIAAPSAIENICMGYRRLKLPDTRYRLAYVFDNPNVAQAFPEAKKQGEDVTYIKTYGDCIGWTTEATETAINDAGTILPYQLGDQNYVLFVQVGDQLVVR